MENGKKEFKQFIVNDIVCKVSGYDISEDGLSFQIQSLVLDMEKGFKKYTIKITTDFKQEEVKNLVGKVIGVKNAIGYGNTSFGSDNFQVLERKVGDEGLFDVNSKITTPVMVSFIKKTGKGSKIQSLVNNGTRQDLFEIGIDGVSPSQLDKLRSKNVIIEGVKVFDINGKKYYKTTKIPRVA